MRSIADILNGRHAKRAPRLPLVHSAPALFIQNIITQGEVTPKSCNVFVGEELSYFFVGRPAYKAVGKDVMHWELPSCLIAEFSSPRPKRAFPFDSGAFSKGLLPSYANIVGLDDFSLSTTEEITEKYIGTFFGSAHNYYLGKPLDRSEFVAQHQVLPTEASVHALLALLSGDRIARELDERRSAIEYQFDAKISLEDGKFLAAIMPEIYLSDKRFIKDIESKGIEIITYPIYPIENDFYYYALYDRVSHYYSSKGYI